MSETHQQDRPPRFTLAILLYNQFDLLQVSSVLSVFSLYPDNFTIQLISEHGQAVTSQQGYTLSVDQSCYTLSELSVLYIPGGNGVEQQAMNPRLCEWIEKQHQPEHYLCASCTGTALLANAGVLTSKSATTNKRLYRWVTGFGNEVDWFPVARWVQDGNIFTASGGIACLDMSLALLAELLNEETARKTAIRLEHIWLSDPSDDPFAPLHIVQ